MISSYCGMDFQGGNTLFLLLPLTPISFPSLYPLFPSQKLFPPYQHTFFFSQTPVSSFPNTLLPQWFHLRPSSHLHSFIVFTFCFSSSSTLMIALIWDCHHSYHSPTLLPVCGPNTLCVASQSAATKCKIAVIVCKIGTNPQKTPSRKKEKKNYFNPYLTFVTLLVLQGR